MQQFTPLHRHLIIKAIVDEPIDTLYMARTFLNHLSKELKIRVVAEPQVGYEWCTEDYNSSGSMQLTTAHVAFHCWEKTKLLLLDVYSYRAFDQVKVISAIEGYFGRVQEIHAIELDRSTMKILKEYKIESL